MNRIAGYAVAAIVLALFGAGCNVGMAPEGASASDIDKAMSKMPLDKQIALINGSPDTPANKAAKIAALKAKYGAK